MEPIRRACWILLLVVASHRHFLQVNASADGGCEEPILSLNGIRARAARHSSDYIGAGEVHFHAEIPDPLGKEVHLCKIKCVNGNWTGPLCEREDEHGKFQPMLRYCPVGNVPSEVIFTYRNVTIQASQHVFPHGAALQARCRDIGMLKLQGESTVRCHNGVWSSRIPHCVPTTLITNFTEDSPPTILVRIPTGSAVVEPAGELAVFPGSIVHLECLFQRKVGNPEWTWTSGLRQYLTGWAIASDERDWKYRLSIYYSKPQDSGTFTCSTPKGLTNSITVLVKAVHCDPDQLKGKDGKLKVTIEGNHLGQVAIFKCPDGYHLNGSANLTCEASGRWSAPVPTCSEIRCPALVPPDPNMRLVEHNNNYGGHAILACAFGYVLDSRHGLTCEASGQWDRPLPTCRPILCRGMPIPKHGGVLPSIPEGVPTRPPAPPPTGRLPRRKTGAFGVGASLRYSCHERYQLVGESVLVCTETGHWSHPPPLCKYLRNGKPYCSYPGEPKNGRLHPVKFSYMAGDKVTVTCNAGYVAPVDVRPECRNNGTWSEPLPECRIYSEV